MAHFRSAEGVHYLFMAGSSKAGDDFGTNVAPSIIRVRVVTEKGKKPYLKLDAREETQVLQNPGSPVISSYKGKNAILWVLDPNVPRSVDVYQPSAPGAKLYAFDAMTMRLLWTSGDRLFTSGKYNEPVVVDGMVLVGTDRLQAFGLGGTQAKRLEDVAETVMSDLDAGRALFGERCAACHLEAASGAPAVNLLAKMPEASIVEALKTGKMKEMGSGLSDQERGYIAKFIRGSDMQ
jgi:mono/diheme cytochrome c family protein